MAVVTPERPPVAGAPPAPDLYRNPELFPFLDSMEGVPQVPAFAELSWPERAQALLDAIGRILPGAALSALLAFAAFAATRWIGEAWLGFEQSPLPPALVAIALGLAIRNAIGLPSSYDAGLRFCVQRVLRVGVALLGLRLSLTAVGAIGLAALPIVVASIAAALLIVTAVSRSMGVPHRLGTLIAVGTAICGNSAIAATAPAIGAKEEEVGYAVGCVTLFGLLALLVYPFASQAWFGDPRLAGIFLGAAIHDTAQVTGAGVLAAQQMGAPGALDSAVVTKLLRNAFMLAVVPGAAWVHLRGRTHGSRLRAPKWRQAIPFFVLGFLALALLRTLGDLGDAPFGGWLGAEPWKGAIAGAGSLSSWCLGLAMAGIGLASNLRRLRRLGLRPLATGLVAAVGVGAVAAALIQLLAPWIRGLAA